MAVCKSDGAFVKGIFLVFRWSVLLLAANYQCGTVAVLMWTAPPPAWNQTSSGFSLAEIETAVYQVRNGSTNVLLRWNYTLLSGQTLQLTTFSIGDGIAQDDIGLVFRASPSGTPNDKYKDLYTIYSTSQFSKLTINKVTEQENAIFQCKLQVGSNPWAYNIRVEVTVPIKLTNVTDQTVLEGSNTTFCEATGKPAPNTTLTRVREDGSDVEVLPQGPTWNFPNINRTASGLYRCTANNEYETVTQVFKVDVIYPAKIVYFKSEHEVTAQQSVSLDCRAEGNPQPTYTWIPCDPGQTVCHESTLNFQASDESVYTFICKVENYLLSDKRNTTIFIASDVINVTLVITGEECTDGEYNQLWKKLSKVIEGIFAGKLGYESVEQKNIRCGSVIVDLALKFSSTARENEVLSILQDAVKNGEFGDFNVSAITGTRDTGITTTMATTPMVPLKSMTWIIVGVVVGVVVVLAVAGGVAWYVYTKRKCKKRDSKVHNGSQGEAGGNVQDEGYVQVNKGHEERANRRTGGGNTSSVPPALYDTAQTGNRGAVRGAPAPQYAAVDKSKKKPRKRQPGELQYAELAEFSAGQGGQRSSLSPTNRHTETQYADVNAM